MSHKEVAPCRLACRLEVTYWSAESLRALPVLVIPTASAATEVLLIHAPYPGVLRFPGHPTSLLHAAAPLADALASRGELGRLGLLDPGNTSEQFYEDLRVLIERAPVRVVAISTSTAAIEETARIVELVHETRGDEVLVVVGGPHEDDVDEKAASRIAGVDVSVAGDGGFALRALAESFLARNAERPAAFVRGLSERLSSAPDRRGRFVVTSRWLENGPVAFDFGPSDVGELAARPLPHRRVRFSVFDAPETVPLLVSRGCSYGACSFCAEGGGKLSRDVLLEFEHVRELVSARPGAALYFQDSIFPTTAQVRGELLPLLRELGVEWGAQVYLGTLSKPWVEELARHGCRYLYTGLESASAEVLRAIGKASLAPDQVIERLGWASSSGVSVGVSLMFGAMALDGRLVENGESIEATVRLAERIVNAGIRVAGFYPNVQTVLPGTALARGLARAGYDLDFYRMPRTPAFAELEDGGVGHNFATVTSRGRAGDELVATISDAAQRTVRLVNRAETGGREDFLTR